MLDVKMVGIDYHQAEIGVRERFALTSSAAADAMCRIRCAAEGCVLLSTCNRTELWVSGCGKSPRELLCAVRGVDPEQYRSFLIEREGHEAVSHLFELSCGLKSQVFGEDQIITQLKKAAAQAREDGFIGSVLENLFRTAVTAGKRVKTEVSLTGLGRSVAASAMEFLRGQLGTLSGVPCMVIGNGEMGRLTASALAADGARVLMTVRQYRHGEVVIPDGVEAIPYDERLARLPEARVVVSATSSPHFTLRAEEVAPLAHPTVFCDLAVPRDIDPAVASLSGASLYDTDQICGGGFSRADARCLEEARAILRDYILEFESWYGFRNLAPIVREISGLAAEDMMGRVEKSIRRLELEAPEREQITARISDAAEKAVGRLVFGLRDSLPSELWESCIEGLRKSAEREAR